MSVRNISMYYFRFLKDLNSLLTLLLKPRQLPNGSIPIPTVVSIMNDNHSEKYFWTYSILIIIAMIFMYSCDRSALLWAEFTRRLMVHQYISCFLVNTELKVFTWAEAPIRRIFDMLVVTSVVSCYWNSVYVLHSTTQHKFSDKTESDLINVYTVFFRHFFQ